MKALINESELKNATATGALTAVLFWASWCGPCKSYKPLVQRITDEAGVPLYGVKVDDHRDIAGSFSVRGVPTLILFREGTEVKRLTGAVGEAALLNAIKS